MSSGGEVVSDVQLVGLVVDGVHEALAQLYRRHGAAVWGLCIRICRDRALAEDVSQHVFCELWASPWRFDADRGSFRSWLLALAHARAVDAVRSETARCRREQLEHVRVGAAPVDVETQVEAGELRSSVREALAGLPDGERRVVMLTYYGGHTYREAAAALGLPEGTVKSRIRAGLQRLRSQLASTGVRP